jgi:hypothetical protein
MKVRRPLWLEQFCSSISSYQREKRFTMACGLVRDDLSVRATNGEDALMTDASIRSWRAVLRFPFRGIIRPEEPFDALS